MSKNIYEKYCNDIQNPALGAAIIANFANTFYLNSEEDDKLSLLMVFVIVPLILNKNFRSCLVAPNGNKASNNLITFLSKIANRDNTANNLHKYVEIFRGYTLTSIIFAKKIGLIEIDNDANVICSSSKIKNLPKDNLYIKASKVLGEYFADKMTLNLLSQQLGVMF